MGLFWLGLVAFLAQPQERPVFRVPARLVTAPTLVISPEGKLVPGLEKDRFRVLDNGFAQKFSFDPYPTPVSVVFAFQTNPQVRQYLRFIRKTGSAFEALLVGETGEAAVIGYDSEVTVMKPFGSGSVQDSIAKLAIGGRDSRTFEAGVRAIELLSTRPGPRARVLVFVGQAADSGSRSTLDQLQKRAEKQNTAVYSLTLPEFGKSFVSDTFWYRGLSSQTDRGGFIAGVDLLRLGAFLKGTSEAASGTDPFTVLTAATGGAQLHVRQQSEFEAGIAAIGVALRSVYMLSYTPGAAKRGYHTIQVEVDVPGAKARTRPGYWLSE